MQRILVTGGCGFIGSHFVALALERGCEVLVVDNLQNSTTEVLSRIEHLGYGRPQFEELDIRIGERLEPLMRRFRPDAVVHFAGWKSVTESLQKPVEYWSNNFEGSLSLLRAMYRNDVSRLVFSSTANLYGIPDASPVHEDSALAPVTPYGQSKLAVEQLLQSYCASNPAFSAVALRYFNPVGAHPSLWLGEDPKGVPANLVPFVMKVATGEYPAVRVFGNDYDTPDGTGVRDYIHIMDLVEGHFAALEHASAGFSVANLGTGTGYSVREVVDCVQRVAGRDVPLELCARRPGDAGCVYADVSRAKALWGWKASRSLEQMCGDAWRYARMCAIRRTNKPLLAPGRLG